MDSNKSSAFRAEWMDMLQSLKERNAGYREADYFLELGKSRSNPEDLLRVPPRVILLGTCFPDEIIRAMNETPFYLLGGSFVCASSADHLVPRDTDSAVKSILGMLTDEEFPLAKDAVILLPMTGDSMKKLERILSETMKVISFEVPGDQKDPVQRKRFEEEILRVTFEVEKHLRRPLLKKNLIGQCRLSENASDAWKEFREVSTASGASVSGSLSMMIADSYHWCSDKGEWTAHLRKLTEEIRQHKLKSSAAEFPHLHVMLMGSPIYAPNYKVPFLIEEMGLEVYSSLHPNNVHITAARSCSGSRTQMLRQLAGQYLDCDMSPAFFCNRSLSERLEEALEKGSIDGIVVHILKGQIEYDFELTRLEKKIDKYELPIFRLETDYHYQDVEQLRIRLEAFAEMLHHRSVSGRMEEQYGQEAI